MDDLISRQAAIDAIDEQIAQCNKALKSLELSMKDEYAVKVEKASLTAFRERLEYFPPAQPEPCEDAVSREKINKFCHEVIKRDPDGDNDIVKAFEAFRAYVNSLPPVTPKQRTGKWIRLDMHAHLADHKCTACEQECYVPTCMGEPLYAFCPNCGSYNGGEQDDKCRQV